jgi:hypothetical protein
MAGNYPILTSLGWGTRFSGNSWQSGYWLSGTSRRVERKVKQIPSTGSGQALHSTFGSVQDDRTSRSAWDDTALREASGCNGVRCLVWQNRGRDDRALDARAEAHGAVFHLFEEVGFATPAAEPEVFHATRGSFAIRRCRPRYVENIDTPLPEVVERFAALWIRAVVHHGGPFAGSYGFARVPRFTY